VTKERLLGAVRSVPAVPGSLAAAGLVGLSVFAISIGFTLADPTRFGWVMYGGDPEIHFFGWHLFRRGPWQQPAGAVPLLRWPVGTSVGLTDSIPILAFAFKPFSALLPTYFQYQGLWLLCAFVLQGIFAALLMRTMTPRFELQLLGATLFVISPPLLYRFNHEALAAHWLILWALWMTLRGWRQASFTEWALLACLAAATHPYLAFMVGALMFAAHAGALLVAPSATALIAARFAILGACMTFILWQCGYFTVEPADLQGGRFGYFSMNLLSPLLPLVAYDSERPWFTPPLEGQYEGYAYFGAGLLLVTMVALYSAVRRHAFSRPLEVRRYVPLWIVLAGLFLLALGPQIAVGGRTVVAYDPGWWGPLTLFRASGRMIWPVFYAAVWLVLAQTVRSMPARAIWVLSAAVALQAFDAAPHVRVLRAMRAVGFANPLQSRFWDVVPPHYRRVVLFPSRMCTAEATFDYRPFALLAGRHGVGINVGGTARPASGPTVRYCRSLDRDIAAGTLDPDSLYVVRSDLVPA
jgi:Family of unknown function (DUF6311)